jgi:hypothetical protein
MDHIIHPLAAPTAAEERDVSQVDHRLGGGIVLRCGHRCPTGEDAFRPLAKLRTIHGNVKATNSAVCC